MKVGFVSRWDPHDKRSWSGIAYSTYTQISASFETEIFTYKWPWYLREWLTMRKSINHRWYKKHTVVEFTDAYAKYFSRKLKADLKKRPVDILFVLASPQYIAYLKTDIPIILMTDATFHQIRDYYAYFSNLSKNNLQEGIKLDKRAFQLATHCMPTSEWNRQSAIHDYGINYSKLSVVHMGPNLERVPIADELSARKQGQCRLLFLGVEWERKGGDIALQTFHLLKRAGLNPTLHIIGCVPPNAIPKDHHITVIPFLDKNKEHEFERLYKIMLTSDFLLLPTKAECSGIVFCEAAAFGFPSVTYDTGGLSDYVENGISGYRLPAGSPAEIFAEKIIGIFRDHALYLRLQEGSRYAFETKLNWNVWGMKFREIAQAIVNKRKT